MNPILEQIKEIVHKQMILEKNTPNIIHVYNYMLTRGLGPFDIFEGEWLISTGHGPTRGLLNLHKYTDEQLQSLAETLQRLKKKKR